MNKKRRHEDAFEDSYPYKIDNINNANAWIETLIRNQEKMQASLDQISTTCRCQYDWSYGEWEDDSDDSAGCGKATCMAEDISY